MTDSTLTSNAVDHARRRVGTATEAVLASTTGPDPAPPTVSELLGARLRDGRHTRGLSVRALAKAVGVSPSLISQIERGKANPSVGTLYAIVQELEISLDELFADGSRTPGLDTPAEAETELIQRAGSRATLDLASGVRWERLTPRPDPNVDFLYVVYQVGGASAPPDVLMRHMGREYGLVLSGKLGAKVGFNKYELAPGDSIAFDSTTPHHFWTIGNEPAVVVWTILGRMGDSRAQFGD
jgi:transcriptional regulator with XRE-family HTH domain